MASSEYICVYNTVWYNMNILTDLHPLRLWLCTSTSDGEQTMLIMSCWQVQRADPWVCLWVKSYRTATVSAAAWARQKVTPQQIWPCLVSQYHTTLTSPWSLPNLLMQFIRVLFRGWGVFYSLISLCTVDFEKMQKSKVGASTFFSMFGRTDAVLCEPSLLLLLSCSAIFTK